MHTVENVENDPPPKKEDAPIPLAESINTISFAFHNVWLINIYMLRFYVTSFNTWAWKTTNDPNQSKYVKNLV